MLKVAVVPHGYERLLCRSCLYNYPMLREMKFCMKLKSLISWKSALCVMLLLVLVVPTMASAAQNHSISSGWNLYSMSFDPVDDDNGRCYQGAVNWTSAAGTTMTENSSSQNKCYWRYYPETWYGLYQKYSTYFTVKVNKDKIEADYPGYSWAASVSSATHEFGHAQYLGDHDTAGEGVYATTSIMSYSRNRTTMTTPQSHDLSDLDALRNPSLASAAEESNGASADFPFYNIDQLLSGKKSDLVIVANVESVQEVKENADPNGPDPEASHQEAVLRIEDNIYGQAKSDTIKLYQSVDKVEAGKKYLLFLSYRPEIDQYVVSDGVSQTVIADTAAQMENSKKLNVKIKGIQGVYSVDELKQLLAEKAGKQD